MSTIYQADHSQLHKEIKKCISDVSSNSKYQHKLIIFFGIVGLIVTLQLYSVSLFYMNPVFKCEGQEDKLFEEDACIILDSCSIINTQTITAELHLYCDSKNDRTLLQVTSSIGGIIGILLVSLSDRMGKHKIFSLCILILNLSWILQLIGTYFANIFTLFIAELIAGVTNKGIYLNFLVLLTRFLRRQDYQWGTIIWLIAYHGLSQIIIAILNAIFHDWKVILYVYAAGIAICSISTLFILKQDPVFLFEIGKIVETKQIIQEVGIQNGENDASIKQATQRIDFLFESKLQKEQNHQSQQHNWFDLREIIRCNILQKILIIGTAGFFIFLVSRSIEFSIQSLQYSYNFNLFIVGFANICGFASATYAIKKQPQRKRGLIYTSILYFLISMLTLFSFCTKNGTVETMVVFSLRFFLCWSCNFFTRLKIDSFTQKYQMTIISFVQFIASLGMVASPILVQNLVDHNTNPIIMTAALRLILGTVPAFFLVEEKVFLDSYQKSKETEKPIEFLQELQ